MILTWSLCCCFFFFKQKTAYEMRISDWSSDVCSSDLHTHAAGAEGADIALEHAWIVSSVQEDQVPIGHVDADLAERVARTRRHDEGAPVIFQIGRASCRERVCQYG